MLASGTKLGPYEIMSPIGAGGMGEVYKARDTRLDRTVAIKILPEHLAGSSEMRERFEREARAVSGLNHPHICRLYDIGSHDGIDFIVMEHLEGETLAERLKKGPLRFEEALRYAREIADALDKAHRHGVVHRDVKPGNVMLTKPGAILLDFGLAKESPARRGLGEDESDAPTHQKPLTDAGAVLGTFQYMAPEQLEGGEIDARTDIFTFGTVLYEMVTGKKAFTGKSQASLIGAILKDDPPSISSLQPTTPAELDRLLRKCLAKDPDERWGSLHDVAEFLSWIGDAPRESDSHKRSRSTPWILAVTGWAVAIGAWMWSGLPKDPANTPVRFSIDTSGTEGVQLTARSTAMAVSPDGQTVVFVTSAFSAIAPSPLYARDLGSLELRSLPGTEGANSPAFSPDGEWVAYQSRPDRKLKKIRLQGGAPQTICDIEATSVRGISWGESDFVYFNQQPLGIFRVSANGGAPELLLAPNADDDVKTYRLPFVLPGGRNLLFVTGFASMDSYDEATISVLSLETGDVKVLIEGGSNPRYSPSGHVVFGRNGAIMAAPFDLDQLELTGQPKSVVSGVMTSHAWGVGQFHFSETGTLAYLPGVPENYYPKISWVDRAGHAEPFAVASRDFREVRFSPDGRKVALRESKGNDDIWSYDVGRGTLTRITSRWDNASAVWAPDSGSILYNALDPGSGVVRRAADGSGVEEVLLRSPPASPIL